MSRPELSAPILYAGGIRQFGGKNLELKVIRYRVEAGVAELRLFRPKRMNAWTGRMHTEYRYCLLQAAEDPEVGAIVVTGEGRGFCVGADAAALSGHVEKGGYDPGTPDPLAEPGFGTHDAFDANFAYHFGIRKPIIAAVNGPAAGLGLALACYADLRLACPGLNFSTAHGKLNFPAEFGLSWLLPRIIGLGHANDLLLSSRKFTSEEGLAMGLFNRLVEPEVLLGKPTAGRGSSLRPSPRGRWRKPSDRSTSINIATFGAPWRRARRCLRR